MRPYKQRVAKLALLGVFCASLLLRTLLTGEVMADNSSSASTASHLANQHLTVATWGGSYEQAQINALFEPFEESTGITIDTIRYSGGLQILNSTLLPDVVDMTRDDALVACDRGLLHKLDIKTLVETQQKEIKASKDFVRDALTPCGIAHLSYATLIAYNEAAFIEQKPQVIADFFDVKRFPGKRALQKKPTAILEWALLAEGVPIDQVYDLLSTERGLRLAFRRLDSIKEHIIWWDTPAQATALLVSGKAAMASGFNGRFFNAQLKGAAISMLWDAQIIDWNVWVIPKQKDKAATSLGHAFIRFVTQTQRMAKLAEIIPYGPSRKSAHKRIGLHADKGFSMRYHLPTAKHHLDRAIFRDSTWYANTLKLRNNRFWQWINASLEP